MLLALSLFSSIAFADSKIDSLIQAQAIPAEHADAFGMLVVQDEGGGRMKPVNTLASEVLRKVSRKSSFKGLSPNQVLLGMAQNPYLWQLANDKVNHDGLKEQLGFTEKYNSFLSFFSNEAKYVLTEEVAKAYAKKPAERSKYDKVIAVDERVNISYMVYNGSFFRFFRCHTIQIILGIQIVKKNIGFAGDDSLFVYSILPIYYQSIYQGLKDNDF